MFSLFFSGGLELASLDSVPHNLVVNASVLGSFSLFVAALFLIDLMGPRTYISTSHSQTDPISSPKSEKKVSIAPAHKDVNQNGIHQNGLNQKGHIPNGTNGHIPERPKDLDLEATKTRPGLLETSLDELDTKLDIEDGLESSKFGSLRNIEGGNYVKLSEPLSDKDRRHYERELARFHERYFREFIDNFAGRLPVREDYLPEPQTPVFSKVKTGRLKDLYDDSPSYEKKSPSKAKVIPSPTLQQLEDYLKGGRNRRADTPAVFPMEPIEERAPEVEGRASGTPTDPGYVQYTAGKWPDKQRELRTPRHSPT